MNQNLVFCRCLGQELPGLKDAPLKGNVGQIIKDNISAQAFNDWLEMQIKIINEERLDLSEESAQERLYQSMMQFLKLDELME
jgi:Fe-S cluster biosynthesis and repair protein YggX